MRLKFGGDKPEFLSVRAWRAISKAGTAAVGWFWERVVKRRKFTRRSESLDDHKPRSAGYLRKKERPYRQITDAGGRRRWVPNRGLMANLEWSGETRRRVMSPHIPRAFPTRVTIDLPTPKYVQMRPYRRNAPNLGEEITATTNAEVNEMRDVFRETTENEIAAHLAAGRR